MTNTPTDSLIRSVIECTTEVHTATGPGLTRETYEACLEIELTEAGLTFERGRMLPMIYDGHRIDFDYRADFVVEGSLLVLVEAEEEPGPEFLQRPRTGLWLGGFSSAVLMNFNVVDANDGISLMDSVSPAERPDPPAFKDVFDDPNLGARD